MLCLECLIWSVECKVLSMESLVCSVQYPLFTVHCGVLSVIRSL